MAKVEEKVNQKTKEILNPNKYQNKAYKRIKNKSQRIKRQPKTKT